MPSLRKRSKFSERANLRHNFPQARANTGMNQTRSAVAPRAGYADRWAVPDLAKRKRALWPCRIIER